MKNLLTILTLLATCCAFAQQKGATPLAQSSVVNRQSSVTRAVVIGISDYQDKDIPDLRFADRDAEAFANFLRSPAGGSLDGDHLKVLTNEQATAGRIAEALDGLIEQSKEGDQVIIYFSGHGDVEGKKISQPGFLLCWDSPSRVYMGGGTYSLSFLQEVVTTLAVQNKAKVTVITDACHAGKLAGSQIGGAQLTSVNLAKQYANEVKILSCQPHEFSLEGEQWGGGRGCFSYHLVDGLFGLADKNGDGTVTVGEIDRYLEDKVTTEAAPQSQVPMLLGNKTERLATVNAAVLADLQKSKASGMPVFAATESRGFEDDILSKLDSGIIKSYFAFKKAVAEKRFFPDSSVLNTQPSADELYASLSAEPGLAPLHGFMKRNYAAALQDDAQQVLNTYLKTGLTKIILADANASQIFRDYPAHLNRAAELLGQEHYMYVTLQARKHYFEGEILFAKGEKEKSKNSYYTALQWQPDQPNAYTGLINTYSAEQPDSAEWSASKAMDLAPTWVVPYIMLANYYEHKLKQPDKAEDMLNKAGLVDSNSVRVWYQKARYYHRRKNFEAAEAWFKKVIAAISAEDICFPCAHFDLGTFYTMNSRYDEAEPLLKKAIQLDSTFARAYSNLGYIYKKTGRYTEAEQQYKRAIQLGPPSDVNHITLGNIYYDTRRYVEAEQEYKKVIALDSTNADAWLNLGLIYNYTHRYSEAEAVLKKAIALDSMYVFPRKHLGMVYFKTNRPDEARQSFLKAIALNPSYAPAMLGMAYLLAEEGKTEEAIGYVEQAIGKGSTFDQLEKDEDLAPLRAMLEWKELMKKHFPDQVKD